MTYSEKLKDPRWQKKRLEILSRDKWTCQVCDSKDKTLNVHHFWYEGNNPWDAPDDALITLCEECHQTEYEERRGFEEELLSVLRKSKFFFGHISGLSYMLTACTDPNAAINSLLPFRGTHSGSKDI